MIGCWLFKSVYVYTEVDKTVKAWNTFILRLLVYEYYLKISFMLLTLLTRQKFKYKNHSPKNTLIIDVLIIDNY